MNQITSPAKLRLASLFLSVLSIALIFACSFFSLESFEALYRYTPELTQQVSVDWSSFITPGLAVSLVPVIYISFFSLITGRKIDVEVEMKLYWVILPGMVLMFLLPLAINPIASNSLEKQGYTYCYKDGPRGLFDQRAVFVKNPAKDNYWGEHKLVCENG